MEFLKGISWWFIGGFFIGVLAESAALHYSRRFGQPLWVFNVAMIFFGAAALFGFTVLEYLR